MCKAWNLLFAFFCCLFPPVFEKRQGVWDGRCCPGLQGWLYCILLSEPLPHGVFHTEKGRKMHAQNNTADTERLRLLKDSPVWSPWFKAKEPGVLFHPTFPVFLPTVWAIVTKYYILDVVSGGVLRPRRDASAVRAETHGIVGLRSNLTGLNPG